MDLETNKLLWLQEGGVRLTGTTSQRDISSNEHSDTGSLGPISSHHLKRFLCASLGRQNRMTCSRPTCWVGASDLAPGGFETVGSVSSKSPAGWSRDKESRRSLSLLSDGTTEMVTGSIVNETKLEVVSYKILGKWWIRVLEPSLYALHADQTTSLEIP